MQTGFGDLLEKAVLVDNHDLANFIGDLNPKNVNVWNAVTSQGEMGPKKGGYRLKVHKILVNDAPMETSPDAARSTAFEEAVRVYFLRSQVFGPNGLITSPDRRAKPLLHSLIQEGLIDPGFKIRHAREEGLRLGLKFAKVLGDEVASQYASANLTLAFEKHLDLVDKPDSPIKMAITEDFIVMAKMYQDMLPHMVDLDPAIRELIVNEIYSATN